MFGILIIKLRKCIMPPPAVIRTVIWPSVIVMKLEIIMIFAVLRDIGAFFVSFRMFVDPLSIHPFIKGATVIEYSVQNNLHASSVRFFHYFRKKSIACLQIILIGYSVYISCGKTVLMLIVSKQLSFVMNDPAEMRINIVIILNIILMIGRRDKQRIKIYDIHTKILQIIHLI